MRRFFLVAAFVGLAACSSSGASNVAPNATASSAAPASSGASSAAPVTSGAPASTSASAAVASASGAASAAPAGSGVAAGGSGDCAGGCLSIEKCEAGACVPACPPNEVYIPKTPASGFTLGRGQVPYGFGKLHGTPANGFGDTPHNVVLTKPFCMDANEVVVKDMVRCVQEQGCREPSIFDRWATYPKKPDYPVNMADWDVSKLYCEKQGQSLPTEAQWEWAATGGDGRNYPWGNDAPDCEHTDYTASTLPSPGGDAGCHGGGPSPVATHLLGDKVWPTGHIHDLAGNVWEWVLDTYGRYPKENQVDPLHFSEGELTHVVRGGGWNRSHKGIMTWFRGAAIHTYKVPGLGFRCVRNPK